MSKASNVESLFFAALEKQSAAERAAFLDTACGGDTELRRQVEKLLKAEARVGDFLQKPVFERLAAAEEQAHESNVSMDAPAAGADSSRAAGPLGTSDHGPASSAGPHPADDGPAVPGYRVLREIARGGMGRVLAAYDLGLDRDVALKVLLPGASADRFVRESKITGRLPHPGIPPVYALGTLADGSPFLAMKLIAGRTLAEEMKSADRPRLLQAFTQVCQAVGFAHSKGIIHRDLKPANVMVGAFGEVQVMDWGLAKDLTNPEVVEQVHSAQQPEPSAGTDPNQTTDERPADESTDVRTQAGQVMGTPAYMAPEQARGEPTDARSDVFALGGILCAILTGQPPYRGGSALEVIGRARAADLGEAHARLDGCGADAELVALCRDCLSPSPADRPANGQAVADGLSAYLNGVQERLQTAQRERAVALTREAEQAKRRKVQFLLVAALLALLIGVGAFAWWRNERHARNAEAVATLLGQVEEALHASDATRAQIALDAARKRAAEGGAEQEAERVARLEAELTLLRELDRVDNFRWTWSENGFPDQAVVATRTHAALARFGADPEAVSLQDAAVRVETSVVRQRIVSALDRLLRQERKAEVRALLRRVDADPYRDAVRDAVLAGDRTKLVGLVDQPATLEQPPGFIEFLAFSAASAAIEMPRVRQLLQAALGRSPGDLGVLMALGNTYRQRRDRVDEQLRWCQAAVAAAPDNFAARMNLGAILCDAKGDYDGAIACFRKATELDAKDAWAHDNLGKALAGKGKMEEAIACHQKAIELDPKHAKAHHGLGVALYGKGKVDEAIAWYRKALALDPKDAETLLSLGAILCDVKRDYDGAVTCFRKVLDLDPKRAKAHYNLGKALAGKGKVEEAIECYQKAIKLDPKHASAHFNLGNALRDKGKVDEAIECFKKATELRPKDAGTHNNLGNAQLAKGKVEEAIACFHKAIALDPKFATAYSNLGKALKAKGKVEEAIASYQKAIDLDPKLAVAHSSLGSILCDVKRDYDAAIACFKKAIALDPKYAYAHNNLGNALKGKGKVREAIACYRNAIDLDPKFALAYANLGVALAVKGQMDTALAYFNKAIALDPKLAMAHNNLGNALYIKGKVEEAIASYQKAIDLEPKFAEAHINLGNALVRKGQVDEAIASFRKASALNPRHLMTIAILGEALLMQKRYAEAEETYRKAVALRPNDPDLHFMLGTVLQAQRKSDEAAAAYREVIRLRPKAPKAHCFLGQILRDQGNFAEALKMLRRGHEFGTKQPGWSLPSAQWVREAEQLVAFEARLPAFLKGEFQPRDTAERLGLIGVCQVKKHYAAAARLFADALAADPKLADDPTAGHRYNGACSAALAAAGKGIDAGGLDDRGRLRWRRQALTWLRADLALHRKQLKSWWPGAAQQSRQVLLHWQRDADLASLRDKEAVAQLPAEERAAFTRLWADVAALLPKAGEQPAQPKVAKKGEGKGDEEAAKLKQAEEYLQAGKRDLAVPLLVEVVKLRKARLGPDHADTLNSMTLLGVTYWQMQQLDKSIPLFEQVLKSREEKLGRDHPDTLGAVANLGVNYSDAGQLQKAIPLLEEAQRAVKKHPQLAWVTPQLIAAYQKAGENGKVAALLLAVRKELPKDSPQLGGLLAQIGLGLLEQKKWAQAEPLLRESLTIREKKEPNAWSTFNAKSMLGGALLGQKKYADAEPLLLAGYKGMKKQEAEIPPPGRPRLGEAALRLVELYEALGKKDEAARWKKERETLQKQAKKEGRP